MQFVGENGVAAYGVIMYVGFVFVAIFIGYSIGTAPIIGYHYGAENHSELKSLFRKSLWILAACSLLMTASAELLASPLSKIFVGYDAALLAMTTRAFMLYSLCFLVLGFNIFASSFFTALNDGLVSGVLSFLRTLLFQVATILLMPLIWELDGVWLAIVASEVIALFVTVFCFFRFKEKYHYI